VAQSKALEFLQKRALNVIFPDGEYATDLIIANVKTLSHDDSSSHSFYQTLVSFFLFGGGMAPRPSTPPWIPHWA